MTIKGHKNLTGRKDWTCLIFSKFHKFSSILFFRLWICSFFLLQSSGVAFPITNSYKLWNSAEDAPNNVFQVPIPNTPNWNLPKLSPNLDLNGKVTQTIDTKPWNVDTLKVDDIWSWGNKFGTDDKHIELVSSIVEIIVYIVLGLVVVSFVAFLICICSPFCVLSQMRHRRTGLIYATRQAPGIVTGTTMTTQGHGQGTQLIAIANQRSNAPYPVQESVTVIPLVTPSHPLSYSTIVTTSIQDPGNVGPQPPNYIQSTENGFKQDPPPPYPGLPPVDSDSTLQKQPPPSYNPYFEGGDANH